MYRVNLHHADMGVTSKGFHTSPMESIGSIVLGVL